MRTKDMAEHLEAWAAEVTNVTSSFSTPPEQLNKALPLVIAEVKRKQRNVTTEQRDRSYQQATVRTWSAELMLLVSPDPSWTASHGLYDMVDALEEALYADRTLGGRVGFASPEVDATFDPPEVEFDDGTVARQATFRIIVNEYAEA